MRIIISCMPVDIEPMSVLLEGCQAHSDFLFAEYTTGNHQCAWFASALTREALETFTEILATVAFKSPDFVRLNVVDNEMVPLALYSLAQFHKHVFHE